MEIHGLEEKVGFLNPLGIGEGLSLGVWFPLDVVKGKWL